MDVEQEALLVSQLPLFEIGEITTGHGRAIPHGVGSSGKPVELRSQAAAAGSGAAGKMRRQPGSLRWSCM